VIYVRGNINPGADAQIEPDVSRLQDCC